jgi:short-subunit dehydrogenase
MSIETLHDDSRWALITGGSSGIGKAMAHRLARSRHNLVLVSERDMELTLTELDLAQKYPDICIETFSADLSVPSAASRLYDAVSRRRPRIDVLINESWTGESDFGGGRSLPSQLRAIRINVEALATLTQRIAGDMIINRGGKILTVAPLGGTAGTSYAINGASSAFVEQFSRELAGQLDGTGVTITCLRAWIGGHGNSLDVQSVTTDVERVAELAFDGLMRGDGLVALDGVHRTPIAGHRTIAPMGTRPRVFATLE